MLPKSLCAVVFWLACATASATAYSPSYTVLRSVAQYDVKLDGGYTEEVQEDLRLNNQSGVEDLSQYTIRFSRSLQSVKVLEAYTLTREGRRVVVKPENMLLQQSSESADAPMFDDSKVLNVVFPALAPGATIHIRFRRIQHIALFPGVFALQTLYSQNEDRESSAISIRLPASMPLQVESIDIPGGEVKSDKPGTRRWLWTMGKHAAEAPENGAVSDTDYSPRLAVSTLGSYDDLARAYLKRATPKAAVSPAIRQLANKITAGIDDPKAQAEALYYWVSKNIRYVGIYFGFGGVVPHQAEQIAHALYGDCKDHVTLFQSLLAAKGIKSGAVLVNAEQSWWLSRVAVPTGAFNHAISYLPEWDLYLDTTAQFAPFGVLPDNELGKRALVTDDGMGQPRLVTLPISNPATDRVLVNSVMGLSQDGRIQGQSQVHLTGIYDFMSRAAFSVVTPGTEDSAAAKMLSARGLQGSGSVVLGNVYNLALPFSYQFNFDLPDYVDLTGPTAVILPSGQDSVVSLAAFANWGGALSERRYAVMLDNGNLEENATLKLPNGVEVLALPRSVEVDSPLGHYSSRYLQLDNRISVHRVLVLKNNPPVLGPERYLVLRQLARAVARDLRVQLLLRPK